MMKAQNQLVVSLTGFQEEGDETNPSLLDLKTMIQYLSMRFASALSEETNILIARTAITEKFKIAKIYSKPIKCIRVSWLIDSFAKNTVLPTDDYQIKQIFYGVHAKLLQITPHKIEKIKKGLEDNGAIVNVISSIKDYLNSREERGHCLIVTEESLYPQVANELGTISHPIVGVEWFEDSMKRKMCKYPQDYALNHYLLSRSPSQRHLQRMRAKLNNLLNGSKRVQAERPIFNNLLVFVHSSVDIQLAHCLKKLIAIHGGVQWLIDCIYLNRRISQEDYLVRSYRPKQLAKALPVIPSHAFETMSYHSYSKKSISMTSSQTPSSQGSKKRYKIQGSLFKGCFFYIQSSHRKQTDISSLYQEITKHKGHVFSSRNQINSAHCFYILKDCPEYLALVSNLKKTTKQKVKIIPVSHRWIKECLNKVCLINLHKDSYIYEPFPFRTPINGFHKMVFIVIGLDTVQKLRLKELYNTLGSVRNTPNKNEITHCLCGPNYQQYHKFYELSQENDKVVFLKYQWLLQCSRAGEVVDCNNFKCEIKVAGQDKDVGLVVNESRQIFFQGNDQN